jgi:signal transduction histidine kinase
VGLVVDAPEASVRVNGDADALGRALHNLLDNAARFTPRGGKVKVTGRAVDGVVEVSVADTGIGIPAEDQPRICEPFYQVRRAGAEREGSGLGLAIVKEVVERHGARLELESSPAGTTWTFRLPRLEESP